MKVKICGLKTLADSLATCQAGADMLGFNFYEPSARYLAVDDCRQIVAAVKAAYPTVVCVGVFVNHPLAQINAIISITGLDLAQLSGDEPPETLAALGPKGFRALRSQTLAEAHQAAEKLSRRATPPAFLLDSHQKGAYGGTGKTGDWQVAAEIATQYPILLAGGLSPENVASAINAVQPWGVDVASGVESQRGVKDLGKIKIFIQQAKAAAQIKLN